MEVWKWIEGYENEYKISDKGNIKSYKKGEKLLKPKLDGKGNYLMICLSKDGDLKYFLIHRLVAKTFIPNPYEKEQVNHIDGNKKNNCVENLEWCTSSENILHALDNDLNKRRRKVLQLDLVSGSILGEFKSLIEASEKTKINTSTIQDNASGRYFSDNDYSWIYKDADNLDEEIRIRLENSNVIQMIDKNSGEVIKEFINQSRAREFLGVTSGAINNCIIKGFEG